MGTPLKRGGPRFSARVYCGQTAGWIKIMLGTEVGLSPGDLVVLDGDPDPSPKRGQSASPIFRPFLLWPNGWMHRDTTGYGARFQFRGLCVRGGSSPLPKKGAGPPSQFLTNFCSVLFCSLAFLDPRVGHTMDVLSPFISILCHSD